MLRLLRQLQWVRAVAGVVLFTVVCGLLADWQWHRRVEVLARIHLVQHNYGRTPVALRTLVPTRASELAVADTWRPLALAGRYAPSETLVVRNRDDGYGSVGFLVLVPLRLTGGGVVMVDRGWVAPGADVTRPSRIPPAPRGLVHVVARARPSESPGSGTALPGQVHTIDTATTVPAALSALGRRSAAADAAALYTGLYAQMVRERPAASPSPEQEDAPSTDQGPHLSYTIQWCLFAIGAWAFLIVHMRRRAYEEDVLAGRRPPRAAVVLADPRRRRSDEEIEDAALDAAELAHASAVQARWTQALRGGASELDGP